MENNITELKTQTQLTPKNENIVVGLVLADLHFGASSGKQLYEELTPILAVLNNPNTVLDYFMILGDYFDAKCSLTSQSAKYALLFMSKVVEICTERKIKIRIIKGTLSHDLNQLETAFGHYMSKPGLDFRLFNNVEEEELFDGYRVLYVPEEYITSKEEYYKEYFEGRPKGYYNLAVVHGAFENVIPVLKSQEYEGMNTHAPIFTEKDFECAQLVLSGHIHKRTRVASNIFYVGSYSRFCHGEELPKGCLLVSQVIDKGFDIEFLENKKAPKYITKDLGTSLNILPAEQVIEQIEKLKKESDIDFLRVNISLEENDTVIANMAVVKNYFQKDKTVKIRFNNELRSRKEVEKEEAIKVQQEEYSYLLDKGMTIPQKVSKYLKATQNYDIDSSIIDKVLNTSDTEIKTGGHI